MERVTLPNRQCGLIDDGVEKGVSYGQDLAGRWPLCFALLLARSLNQLHKYIQILLYILFFLNLYGPDL